MRACIMTLLVVYPVFLAAGIWFYLYVQKKQPRPFPEGDPRNRAVRILRLALFPVLLPLGATLALGALGWLDPLFHYISSLQAR